MNAIIPAILNYVATHLLRSGMKLTEKKTILEERLTHFSEMFTSFIHSEEEQLEAIYTTAISCAKAETLKNTFHVVMQLLY